MLSFFPRDALDEILDLIESVSEGFPTYSFMHFFLFTVTLGGDDHVQISISRYAYFTNVQIYSCIGYFEFAYVSNCAIAHVCHHWLGAYRTYVLYSGHIFVRFNDLEDVFT